MFWLVDVLFFCGNDWVFLKLPGILGFKIQVGCVIDVCENVSMSKLRRRIMGGF